jgi:4-diphosphocytidyl-2-C-methyl-D-erythritol kinase
MIVERDSPCKVNVLLNVLGRRPDGFHELETVIQPVPLCDRLAFQREGTGLELTCSDPALPVDASNLVHRAARAFLQEAGIADGVRIHLEKRLPLAAGLGGGSANAAITLRALNSLFEQPLSEGILNSIARGLGSDVPFFLQKGPALCTGRGERIESLEPFAALAGKVLLLVRPGFGVPTAWAYRQLARHPQALNGRPGRALELAQRLSRDEASAVDGFFNSLEAPVFEKYPLLALLKKHLLEIGALAALMSGSGSTTFALTRSVAQAETMREEVLKRFGSSCWTGIAPLPPKAKGL